MAQGRFRLKESCVVKWTCLWAFVKMAPKEAKLPWKPVPHSVNLKKLPKEASRDIGHETVLARAPLTEEDASKASP